MEENVTRLHHDGKEIILIATAHVSQQSVELVKKVIEEEQPDSVCIELDEGRYKNIKDPEAWQNTDVIQVIKQKRVGFMIANLALGAYQRRMAKKLGTNVGGEMIQGIKSAEETGAQLVLADRDIQTTFMRIWRSLTLGEKWKLLTSFLFSDDDEDDELKDEDLQELLQSDMLESVLAEVKGEFPKIGEILISERDQYLAYKIKEAPGPKVVAVLGGAHVPGVTQEIKKTQDIQRIIEVPKKGKAGKIVGWAIPIIILGVIVYSFVVNFETGVRSLQTWIIWNGGLAALFSILSLAHPLAILTAFVAAPITSLNPLLACGWFAGLVQATVKKPTVKDVQNVSTDIFSFKGWFVRNRFLKALMVVVMANIGSSIGTFVAGTDMIRNLF